jgi:phage/plasmid-associated DNA primase
MLSENSQINEFLECLGYCEGEKVFIRIIPIDKNDKEKPPKNITLTYPINNLPKQESGYGVYFVVNGQGNSKKDIKIAKALFCEFDHLSYDEQLTILDKFKLPHPTIQLFTGGKSIHHYWVFDQPVPIEQWQELIKDLIDYVGSDPAVKDPSRIMRLPDYTHYSKDEKGNLIQGQKSKVIGGCFNTYSYQTLRDLIPRNIPKEIKRVINNHQITDNKIINFIKDVIKPHQKGSNTYQNYRELLGAIKQLYGKDIALNIADIIGLDDDYNWSQIIESTNGNFGNGTLYYQLMELGFITKSQWTNLFKPSNLKSLKLTVTSEEKDNQEDNTSNENLINESWINIATNELFSGNWISLNNVLYQYNDNYYEEKETVIIKRKIVNWCANYIDEKGKKSKANPTSVENVLKWVNALFGVSPSQVNCEGIPLKNGYLALIKDENNNPKFQLKPYSPNVYFTYQSEVSYDPNASLESAIKLLECLDEPYKSLFIKSISTVLSFKTIRKKWDRIKALLLIGDGSNGKDTLREVISLILGEQGITSCSLNDFSQSRGFNLARLATNPKLNWSSENKEINIDSIQSLKQAITGDPLFIEGKGKDGFEVKLSTLFIFNTNHKPDLKGNQFAMQSRLTLIPFPHTFSMRPKKGELQADPRFKHDKNFLVNVVAPAFLNLLIDAFGDVYEHGINYQESESYFNEVIEENNHLRRFAKEMGLVYTGNDDDRLTIGYIYSHLLEYYFDNGYVEFETKNEKVKNIWLDEDKRDPVVKLSKNLKPRILELFPKVKEKCCQGKKYLCGIKFDLDSLDSPKNPETIDNKEFKGNHVDSPIDSPKTNLVTHLATNLDSPNLKNGLNSTASQTQNNLSESQIDPSINQQSGYQDINNDNEPEIIKNESKNQKSESRLVNRLVKGESKVSQQVSQEKPENLNKNNTFTNLGESTQEKVSQEKNEVDFMEAIKTINDFLETKKGLVDKEERRDYIKAFIKRDYKNFYDLSDHEVTELYKHYLHNQSKDLPEQKKPDFKIGDKVRSCGGAIYEIVKVNDDDSMEGKCLDYSEFPQFIGQTLNIKNKQIKEIIESSYQNEKQCLSFFDYSVGENVYVLKDNNWVSAIVEQILSYGIKVKLSFGYQMIANTNSICRKIS